MIEIEDLEVSNASGEFHLSLANSDKDTSCSESETSFEKNATNSKRKRVLWAIDKVFSSQKDIDLNLFKMWRKKKDS